MKIATIYNTYSFKNMYNLQENKDKNLAFKGWNDFEEDFSCEENGDYGSIFYYLDKKKRENNVQDIYNSYITYNEVGYPPEKPELANLPINALRYIGNSCYKGGMSDASNYVKELKDSGIERMIILCEPSECDINKACNENKMENIRVHIPLAVTHKMSENDFLENFSCNNFINALEALRKGNTFVGCESGSLRTKRFLSIAKILDPECKIDLGSANFDRQANTIAKWIYKRLSELNKKKLNYTKEFEDLLKLRLL